MSIPFVDDPAGGREVADRLREASEFGLDLEAAGFHRYSDRLCLVQMSTREDTWVVDPLAFDVRPVLAEAVEDPGTRTVMHGADFDLRLLDRDLDLHVSGLFDTQAAASLLGEPALGLDSLLDEHLGVELSKKHQRSDWARRPLPAEMLRYAADDTRHLLELADVLRAALRERNRLDWVRHEFRALEEIRWEEDPEEDPVTRVDGARDLDLLELARLREALEWRDVIARERDRAPFRIAGDRALLAAAVRRPDSPEALAEIRGISRVLSHTRGEELLAGFRRVEQLPRGELRPYPSAPDDRRRRPPPEVEERMSRLKSARNRRASELGIDRGTLLPNATLEEIAREVPRSRRALERIPGVKEWQVEATGEAVLSALAGEEAA